MQWLRGSSCYQRCSIHQSSSLGNCPPACPCGYGSQLDLKPMPGLLPPFDTVRESHPKVGTTKDQILRPAPPTTKVTSPASPSSPVAAASSASSSSCSGGCPLPLPGRSHRKASASASARRQSAPAGIGMGCFERDGWCVCSSTSFCERHQARRRCSFGAGVQHSAWLIARSSWSP